MGKVRQRAAVRARHGGRLLDRLVPDWYRQVDPSTLDLASTRQCVLGQVFRGRERDCDLASGFWWAVQQLPVRQREDIFPPLYRCGFDVPAGKRREYAALKKAWRTEITNRCSSALNDKAVAR